MNETSYNLFSVIDVLSVWECLFDNIQKSRSHNIIYSINIRKHFITFLIESIKSNKKSENIMKDLVEVQSKLIKSS